MPKMKHPDSSLVIEPSPAQVRLYLAQGWKKYTPRTPSASKSGKQHPPAAAKAASNKE